MKTGVVKDASWRKQALKDDKGRKENIISQTASKREDMDPNEHATFRQR